MARVAVPGSATAIRLSHSTTLAPLHSPAVTATISAGLLVLALNGLSRATGQPEPSGTTTGYKTKAAGTHAAGRFAGDVISINNRSINMFTAGLNYKFGGGWW